MVAERRPGVAAVQNTAQPQVEFDLTPGVEVEAVPQNGFSSFIAEHSEQFGRYAVLKKEMRVIEEESRQAFVPLVTRLIDSMRNLPNANSKRMRAAEAQATSSVFDPTSVLRTYRTVIEKPVLSSDIAPNVAEGLAAGRGQVADVIESAKHRASLAIKGGMIDASRSQSSNLSMYIRGEQNIATVEIGKFQADYAEKMGPLLIESHRAANQLSRDLIDHLLSDYQALIDLPAFLTDPVYALQREHIRAFMRDFTNSEIRQGDRIFNWPTIVREYWQQKGKGEFNKVVFERFWENLVSSQTTSEVKDYLILGAKIGMAMRDEMPSGSLTPEDIGFGMARIPFHEWPQSLIKAYANFVTMDVATLVDEAKRKSQDLYPKKLDKEVLIMDREKDLDDSKKRINVVVDQVEIQEPHDTEEESQPIYRLGLVKRITVQHSSHEPVSFESVDEDLQEEEIGRLAKVGKTPQMKEDLKEVITLLVENPYREGTKKMVERAVGNGKDRNYWRRFDPSAVREVKLRDPETRRWRIIYIVIDNIVAISEVLHHSEFDRLGRRDRRAFS